MRPLEFTRAELSMASEREQAVAQRRHSKLKLYRRRLRVRVAREEILYQHSTILEPENVIIVIDKDTETTTVTLPIGINGDDVEMNGICPICNGEFLAPSHVAWSATGDCRHLFCFQCICDWIVHHENDSCPLCRDVFLSLEFFSLE